MSWSIEYSKDADKFRNKNPNFNADISSEIKKLVLRFTGSPANIDFKKLHGKWEGYFRIRKGQLRIIIKIIEIEHIVYVRKIDFRGSVY